ncbi:MAG: methyltransferase family protein [Vicinamibacteria bacterium]
MAARWLARWRVPLGWILGLAALYVAKPRGEWLLAGIGVAAIGEALRLWASGHLEKDQGLTTSGPYAWTRNPLYLGSLFVGLGFCIAAGRFSLLILLAGLFAAVYVPVMKREARRLEAVYPADYSRYAAEVPLFVPRPPRNGAEARERSSFSWRRVGVNREYLTVIGLLLVAAFLSVKWMLGG